MTNTHVAQKYQDYFDAQLQTEAPIRLNDSTET